MDLDLDAIQPEPKKVKLCGKAIDVHPPKFKSIVKLLTLTAELRDLKNDEKGVRLFEEFKEALLPIVPALKDDDMDISLVQLNRLLEFVFALASPEEMKEAEKKIPKEQEEPKESQEVVS